MFSTTTATHCPTQVAIFFLHALLFLHSIRHNILTLQCYDMQAGLKCSFSLLHLIPVCLYKFKLPSLRPLITLSFLFQIIIILLHSSVPPSALLSFCLNCLPCSNCLFVLPTFFLLPSHLPLHPKQLSFKTACPCFGVADPPRLSPLPTVSHLTPYFTAELRLISPQSSEQRSLYCRSTLNYPQLKPNANEKIALLWNYFKRTRVSRMDWRKSWV